MKFRNLKIAVGTLATVASVSAFADQTQIDTFSKQLSQVRAAELPREAATLVTAAKLENQDSTAEDVVRAALKVNPASAPVLVGAIARSASKTAPVAAGTAASIQPKLIGGITKAAIGAAPKELAAIVSAVCKAQPGSFYTVGVAAAEVAPNSSKEEIVGAIASAVPALKPLIERANADFAKAKQTASVGLLLKHSETLLQGLSRSMGISSDAVLAQEFTPEMNVKLAALSAVTPIQGPPFNPNPNLGPELTPLNTGAGNPNIRQYSTP